MTKPNESKASNHQEKNKKTGDLKMLFSTLNAEAQHIVVETDKRLIHLLDQYSVLLLRYSLAAVFFWFGVLKPIGVSSATKLVSETVYFLPAEMFVPILGFWEMAIGICLLDKRLLRVGIALLMLQMAGTFLPLVLLPNVSFIMVPFVPSLEGQYIIKNLVLISGALVVASYSLNPIGGVDP